MLNFALWVLEQEFRAVNWVWKTGEMSDPGPVDTRTAAVGAGLVIGAAAFQTAYIARMPYSQLIRWVGHEQEFLRKLVKHTPRKLGGKGVPIGFSFRPFGPKFMQATAGRKLAARVAVRFVPYVGWGLFAVDVGLSARWIYNKFHD